MCVMGVICHSGKNEAEWQWVILIMRLCRTTAKVCACVFERVRFRVTALVDVSISVIAGCFHPVTDLNRRSQWAMFFGLARLTAFVPKLPLTSSFNCSSFSVWNEWKVPLCKTAFLNVIYILSLLRLWAKLKPCPRFCQRCPIIITCKV